MSERSAWKTAGEIDWISPRRIHPLYKNKPPIKVTAPVPPHMVERLTACGWNEAMDRNASAPLGLGQARTNPVAKPDQ